MGLELGGKHRGIVESNNDPEKLGRLKVRVPAVYGHQPTDVLPWAWPCLPPEIFSLPEKGAGVWVEFLWNNGEPDPSSPVWSGIWYPIGTVPSEVDGAPEDAHYYTVVKTGKAGLVIVVCDKPGTERIEIYNTITGKKIIIDDKVRLNP